MQVSDPEQERTSRTEGLAPPYRAALSHGSSRMGSMQGNVHVRVLFRSQRSSIFSRCVFYQATLHGCHHSGVLRDHRRNSCRREHSDAMHTAVVTVECAIPQLPQRCMQSTRSTPLSNALHYTVHVENNFAFRRCFDSSLWVGCVVLSNPPVHISENCTVAYQFSRRHDSPSNFRQD